MNSLGTNYEIADLLLKQTYRERLEMADTFRLYVESYYENETELPSAEEIAQWFDAYTESLEY